MKKLIYTIAIFSLLSCSNEKQAGELATESTTESDSLEANPKNELEHQSAATNQTEENSYSYSSDLSGVYEYEYEHNTEDLIENHYLQFKDNKVLYFGTSDDFDEAREGYYPGFFSAEAKSFEQNGDSIKFTLAVDHSSFYKNPITPYKSGANQPWKYGIMHKTRKYQGKVNGDTIVIADELGPRRFIKKKKG